MLPVPLQYRDSLSSQFLGVIAHLRPEHEYSESAVALAHVSENAELLVHVPNVL